MNRYIIVGKAASGKDWLRKKMVDKGYKVMKQYTTRPVRENETGDEYYFVDDDEYKKMEDEFISSNFYAIGWYGISFSELIFSDVAILSPANVKDVFEKYPYLRKEFEIIYLDIPVDVRRERLNKRYKSKIDDDNERRIEADERDFKDFKDYDIALKDNDDVDEFLNNLCKMPKNKKERLIKKVLDVVNLIESKNEKV